MCLPQQRDLILPRGRDGDRAPLKSVGKIFTASPLLRPRPNSGRAVSSLPTIAETDQPIVISDDDDDDAQMTGGSTGSGLSGAACSKPRATTGRFLCLLGLRSLLCSVCIGHSAERWIALADAKH